MDAKELAIAAAKDSLEAIARAEAQYQEDVRAALAIGVSRARLAAELGVSGEKIRQDTMTEEERAELRAADAERKRVLREKAGSTHVSSSKSALQK